MYLRCRWNLLGALALLAALVTFAPASADRIDDGIAKADKRLVSRLTSISAWAANKRVSGFRHRVFRLILTISPDNKRARGALMFKRTGKDGPWVQDSAYREPPDWARGVLQKADARVKVALQEYRDAVLASLDSSGEEGAPRLEAVLERLFALLPEDPTLEERRAAMQERRGNVRYNGRWVLPGTVAAIKRRLEIKAYLANQHPRLDAKIHRFPPALDEGWAMGWANSRRKVYGSISKSAGRECLLAMEMADTACGRILGRSLPVRGPRKSILLSSREEARRFLSGKAKWAKQLAVMDKVAGLHLPDAVWVTWRPEPDNVRAASVRTVVGAGLQRSFGNHQRGWITEGMGQRITWHVIGRHGPSYLNLESTELHRTAAEGGGLPRRAARWIRAAGAVLERDGPRRLAGVMTRRLNAMKPPDVLVAYGLAAFLIEARPEALLSFTTATVERHDVDAIVRDFLGADDVKMLCQHLRRWLAEN